MKDQEKNIYGWVYLLTYPSGSMYIGKFVYRRSKNGMNPDWRWEHYYGSGVYARRALKKYGKKNIVKTILTTCTSEEELKDAERTYITDYRQRYPNKLRNIHEGGGGGNTWDHLPEKRKKVIRQKLSENRNSQSYIEGVKEIYQEKHGVDWYFQSEEFLAKQKARWAEEGHTFHNPENLDKRVQTWQEHYGVDNPSQADEVKRKKAETLSQTLGENVSCPFKSKQVQEKIRQTCLDRYGTTNPSAVIVYCSDGRIFLSKSEAATALLKPSKSRAWLLRKITKLIEKNLPTPDGLFLSFTPFQ
jgi:hypothetical protein